MKYYINFKFLQRERKISGIVEESHSLKVMCCHIYSFSFLIDHSFLLYYYGMVASQNSFLPIINSIYLLVIML